MDEIQKEMIMWDKYDNCYRNVVDIEVAKGLEADLYEANNRIVDLMDIIDERDKIIDLMANEIYIEHNPHFNTVEEVKEYFEKRCK